MTTKNNIPLTLTTQQRELLFKYIHLLKDEEITQLLTIALKKDDKYEIYLAEEQIEDLCETLFSIATDEVDHQLQSDLDDLETFARVVDHGTVHYLHYKIFHTIFEL